MLPHLQLCGEKRQRGARALFALFSRAALSYVVHTGKAYRVNGDCALEDAWRTSPSLAMRLCHLFLYSLFPAKAKQHGRRNCKLVMGIERMLRLCVAAAARRVVRVSR